MKQSFEEPIKKPTVEIAPAQATIPIQKKSIIEPTLKTPTSTNSFWGNMVKEKQEERSGEQEAKVKKSIGGNTIDLRQ